MKILTYDFPSKDETNTGPKNECKTRQLDGTTEELLCTADYREIQGQSKLD